jgi:hypothetical protein
MKGQRNENKKKLENTRKKNEEMMKATFHKYNVTTYHTTRRHNRENIVYVIIYTANIH